MIVLQIEPPIIEPGAKMALMPASRTFGGYVLHSWQNGVMWSVQNVYGCNPMDIRKVPQVSVYVDTRIWNTFFCFSFVSQAQHFD